MLSLRRQCELLSLCRSAYYHQPQGETEENLIVMRHIDELYLVDPAWGARKALVVLRREGWEINLKRVRRLRQLMGLEALYPKPRLSMPGRTAQRFPYLLRDRQVTRSNEVWCADITYIPMARGFLYLFAIMDWHSRKVLAWKLSNTLEAWFCLEALEEALVITGVVPEIFNTDKGCQFTGEEWITRLQALKIAISHDGKGRWMDNVFIERLWRSLKYEDIYLKCYQDGVALDAGLTNWFYRYNNIRPHQSLQNKTPHQVYIESY